MSKVKMLLDVVEEVKKEAPQDVPNWTSKLAESKVLKICDELRIYNPLVSKVTVNVNNA